MASSSALQLGDLALTWSNATGDADPSMIDNDLASDRDLETAMLLSIFLDARAKADDVPPSGDARDRRGCWADEFAAVAGDLIGSRLWLLDRAKRTTETELLAKQYVTEALAWLLVDKVAASVDVGVTTSANGLAIAVALTRPGRDPISFRFAHVWDHQQEDL